MSKLFDYLQVRKFKLSSRITLAEESLENISNRIADHITPLHRQLALDCFKNMSLFGEMGCRIGSTVEKAYSGVTQVVDFCAHAHYNTNNMIGGCTAIVTLTKENREERGREEQYHCLSVELQRMESGSSSSMEETAVAEDCKEALQNPEMGGGGIFPSPTAAYFSRLQSTRAARHHRAPRAQPELSHQDRSGLLSTCKSATTSSLSTGSWHPTASITVLG